MSHICKSGDESEIYDDGCELLPDMEKMADVVEKKAYDLRMIFDKDLSLVDFAIVPLTKGFLERSMLYRVRLGEEFDRSDFLDGVRKVVAKRHLEEDKS